MTTYATLKSSLRPSRRIWAAIGNVSLAQDLGEDLTPHLTALSDLYHSFLTRRVGPVMDEAARMLEELGGEVVRADCRPLFLHEIAR